MAKTKCIICKLSNMLTEAEKHPSLAAMSMFSVMFNRLADRDPEAIASICETHRNPLQFNTLVIHLHQRGKRLVEAKQIGIPVSVMNEVMRGQNRS